MASVISKKINGKIYYYLAVSAQVEGRPRIVEQKDLGSAEDIAVAMAGARAVPERSRHLASGIWRRPGGWSRSWRWWRSS